MDQCTHCIAKGDIEKCMATRCNYHELWMVKQLNSKLHEAEGLLHELVSHIHTINFDMGGSHQYHLSRSGWPVITQIKAWLSEY